MTKRPRVFFEEWDDPLICGISWVSELIAVAGGVDIFVDRAIAGAAKGRIATAEEVVAAVARSDRRFLVWQEVPARTGARVRALNLRRIGRMHRSAILGRRSP